MSKTIQCQRDFGLDTEPKCVLVDGPQDNGNDEPEWTVIFGDDEGECIDNSKRAIWYCDTIEAALEFGWKLAKKYGLEFVSEAMAA